MNVVIGMLRGVNLGPNKRMKMEDLRAMCEGIGLCDPRTFIQSGNVIFDSPETDRKALVRKIERKLLKVFGHQVTVVLLTLGELKDVLKSDPFKKTKPGADVMMFVAFLAAEPETKTKLPLVSAMENLEVLAIKHRAAFILCRRKKNGLFAFPTNFFEKQFAVAATTRNWTTVNKIVALADAEA